MKKSKFTLLWITLFLVILISPNANARDYKILTENFPDAIILSGDEFTVYGTTGENQITVQQNADVELINFPGNNTIIIEGNASEFIVSRSGATVSIENEESQTYIKIPATLTVQNLVFDDQTLNLYIESGSVMLSDQEILTDSEYNPEPEVGYFIDGPVEGLSYETSSGRTGKTGSNGEFYYETDDTVIFKLGSFPLGAQVTADFLITPLEICETDELTTSIEAVNVVRLLLTLDTGDNPFGLSMPDIDSSAMNESFDLQSLLEETTDFASEVESFIETVTDFEIDQIDIPSEQDAIDHFELSMELIEEIEQRTDENLFVTIRVPEGKSGSISLSYHLDILPPGVDSYTSGSSTWIDSLTQSATFSEFLYEGDWILTMFHLEDPTRVQTGDLFCFYNTQGFQPTPPSGYTLHVGSGNVNLAADLSTDGGVVEKVYTVSGIIQVPKYLPDGTDLALSSESTSLTIFYSILESPDNMEEIASFRVSPDWPASSEWTTVTEDSVEYYVVDYSTTLPAGFLMKGQIYLIHGDRGDGEDDYEIIEFYTFDGPLNADVSHSDYVSLEDWQVEEDEEFSARTVRAANSFTQKKENIIFIQYLRQKSNELRA